MSTNSNDTAPDSLLTCWSSWTSRVRFSVTLPGRVLAASLAATTTCGATPGNLKYQTHIHKYSYVPNAALTNHGDNTVKFSIISNSASRQVNVSINDEDVQTSEANSSVNINLSKEENSSRTNKVHLPEHFWFSKPWLQSPSEHRDVFRSVNENVNTVMTHSICNFCRWSHIMQI